MIDAYAQWDEPKKTIELFEMMEVEKVRAFEVVLIKVLTACVMVRDLETVKRVHECIDDNGLEYHSVLMSTLLDASCKCGSVLIIFFFFF